MAPETTDTSVSDYLQDLVLNSPDVEEFLSDLCRFSAERLSNGTETLCGITLLRHRKAGTVASSSERAQRMDEIQYNFSDGPCLRASREQVTIHIPDLRSEQRWPEYTAAVVEHGMRSILAVPFALESDTKAALNIYADEPHAFNPEAIETAERHAIRTSKSLRLAVRMAQQADTAANLRAALHSRTTIDLAVGIIMGQNKCSQDAAAQILKTASSTRNVKLRDLAAELVARNGGTPATTHFDA